MKQTNITLTDEQIKIARYFANNFLDSQTQWIPDVQEALDRLEEKIPEKVIVDELDADWELWGALIAEKQDGFIFGFATALQLVQFGLTSWETIEKVIGLIITPEE